MNNIKFINNYFKFLFLLFWGIVWYNVITMPKIFSEFFIQILFCLLSIIYIILILCNKNKFKKIDIFYRMITLLSFISFLFSYVLFSKNITLLLLKLFFIFVYFYISCLKNFKYNMNEGVVGILSSLLLLTITLYY